MKITQSELKKLLSYSPETGVFVWLVGQRAGKVAGSPHCKGYLQIKINGKKYLANRLAWVYVKGKFPCGDTDHANGIRNDNRIGNLRECSKAQNQFNVGIRRTNTSGFRGVSWVPRLAKWQARIKVNGKRKSLGHFKYVEQASAAYEAKAIELHGDFYREACPNILTTVPLCAYN